jgi:hypothetical protein
MMSRFKEAKCKCHECVELCENRPCWGTPEETEEKRAPWRPYGRCTFLTEEGLCELHDKGLKPLEGRVATCKITKESTKNHAEARAFIVKRWKTKKGKATVEKFKNG